MKEEKRMLTRKQAAWLELIKPPRVHRDYKNLREEKAPGTQDALFDKGNFRAFVRGKRPCARELAETVFEAYRTTPKQLHAIQQLPLHFFVSDKGGSTASTADEDAENFFESSGKLLWSAAMQPGKKQPATRKGQDCKVEETLLDLLASVLEKKVQLTRAQKHIVFEELLVYLLETRQHERWGKWMVALSHGGNRDWSNAIRSGKGDGSFFPGCKLESNGERRYDREKLENLTEEELDGCTFFVRRLNMCINELRHRDYAKREKTFAQFVETSGSESKLLPAMKTMLGTEKILVRHYFRWALENVKPYMEEIRRTGNPYRWHFLACASRLMYDWGKWHWGSVLEEDKRAACRMFHDIRELATECRDDAKAPLAAKCQFGYMAATACRYLAEAASARIWGEKWEALDYVSDAVEFAEQALTDWETGPSEELRDGKLRAMRVGKRKAFTYRFARHFARMATFAARWWLLHPSQHGGQPHLRGENHDYPEEYGRDLLQQAKEQCERTLCRPISVDENALAPVVLEGKRQLEYEFHLRVWIEMLAFHFEHSIETDMEDISCAMSYFCRMLLIYGYLFHAGDRGAQPPGTALSAETMKAARDWLARNDYFSEDFSPFDVSLLDRTAQKETPSLADTRFETACAFMYTLGPGRSLKETALWKTLNGLKRSRVSKVAKEFLDRVWGPGKAALETDIADSVGMINDDTKEFDQSNPTRKKRLENWKQYPPFCARNALVNAPGNNPDHVANLMSHYGLEWDRIKKEKAKEKKEAPK